MPIGGVYTYLRPDADLSLSYMQIKKKCPGMKTYKSPRALIKYVFVRSLSSLSSKAFITVCTLYKCDGHSLTNCKNLWNESIRYMIGKKYQSSTGSYWQIN